MKKRIELTDSFASIWLQSGSFWDSDRFFDIDISQNDLSLSSNSKKLTVTGKFQIVNKDFYELNITIVNNMDYNVDTKVNYPYILYKMDCDDIRVLNPTFGGILDRYRWQIAVTYPGQASFCLTAAATAKAAVASGLYNKEQYITTIRNCPGGLEGHMRFTLEKVTIKANSSLSLPTMFICAGEQWAEAITPYKNFIAEAFPMQNPKPQWMDDEQYSGSRGGHCLAPFNPPEKAAGIWLFSELNTVRSFQQVKTEIDNAITIGEQQGFRPLFYQFGWWENLLKLQGLYMFDSFCGDYTAAHSTARQIVDYIHQRGYRTYLYTNAIAAGDETETFKNHPELFVHSIDGLPVYNDRLPMYMFCPSAPGIREYWDDILQFILVDMGADGIFLDQICGAVPPALCYDASHNHPNTYSYGTEIIKLVSYIREKAKQIKPDCCVMGELVLDSRSVLLDESHGYGYSSIITSPPEETEHLKNYVPSEYYIFTRFLCPYIYTQAGSQSDLMNGAAGSFGNDLWKKYHKSFEAGVYPCKTSRCGAIAYLFGDGTSPRVLAVKADGDIGKITVTLPDGKELVVEALKEPQYIIV